MLHFALMHIKFKQWCNRRERHSLLLSLMAMPRLLSQDSRMLSPFSRLSRPYFCITSLSLLLHFCECSLYSGRPAVICVVYHVWREHSSTVLHCAVNQWTELHIGLCRFGLGFKAAFVEQPLLRLSSLIRSVDVQKVITSRTQDGTFICLVEHNVHSL